MGVFHVFYIAQMVPNRAKHHMFMCIVLQFTQSWVVFKELVLFASISVLWFSWTPTRENTMDPIIRLGEHHKIFKICFSIFQHYAWS